MSRGREGFSAHQTDSGASVLAVPSAWEHFPPDLLQKQACSSAKLAGRLCPRRPSLNAPPRPRPHNLPHPRLNIQPGSSPSSLVITLLK